MIKNDKLLGILLALMSEGNLPLGTSSGGILK